MAGVSSSQHNKAIITVIFHALTVFTFILGERSVVCDAGLKFVILSWTRNFYWVGGLWKLGLDSICWLICVDSVLKIFIKYYYFFVIVGVLLFILPVRNTHLPATRKSEIDVFTTLAPWLKWYTYQFYFSIITKYCILCTFCFNI